MVPRTHKLSVLGRKMYNVLLFISQSKLREMAGLPSAIHLFEASLSQILKICDAEGQHKIAKQYLTEMRRSEVEWDSPDANSDLQTVSFSLLSETRISLRNGDTWIQWALPPSLYESLIDPRRWASIDLLILAKLSSYAAVALYEICTKYRDNYNGLTSKNEPVWWVDALSSSPAIIDSHTGIRKRREWRKVKNEFVLNAVEEINSKTDLTVELIEQKGGRGTVLTVQFRVVKKTSPVRVNEFSASHSEFTSTETILFAGRLGVKGQTELAAMAKEHGQERLFSTLQKLESRQQQTKLPIVKSPVGYLKHLLDKETLEKPVLELPKLLVATSPIPKKLWLTTRREEIFEEIMLLAVSDQKVLVRKCIEQVRIKGSLTASIERRGDREEWAVGLLKSLVTDMYALEKYGQSWTEQP